MGSARAFPQTNPLIRYDVLSSEKRRCSGREGFPERSRGASGSFDENATGAPIERTGGPTPSLASLTIHDVALTFSARPRNENTID